MPIICPCIDDVLRGVIKGRSAVRKFGYNSAVALNSTEDIWETGGFYPWPTSALSCTIESDDDADDADGVGAGAWTVELYGLDANYEEISVSVDLDGQTPIPVPTYQFLRFYRGVVTFAGSAGWNVGNILVKSGGTTYLQITPTNNQTLMTQYTVPAGHYGFITQYDASLEGSQPATVKLVVRPFGEVFQVKAFHNISEGSPHIMKLDAYYLIGPKADVVFRGLAGPGGAALSAGFQVRLFDEELVRPDLMSPLIRDRLFV